MSFPAIRKQPWGGSRLTLARCATGLAALLLLGACTATPEAGVLQNDPFAAQNRPVHDTNMQIDKSVYGPVSRAYGEGVPAPVRKGVTNLHENWDLPAQVIQYALQGNAQRAAEATGRFLVNTTIGLAGVLDPATSMGLPYRETGFDETFYLWGIPEGGYVEIPLGGPGTQRDWTAWTLDQFANPAYYVLPVSVGWGLVGIAGLDLANDRYELDPTLTELMHNSADSYTALRISYLQNKVATLQGGTDVSQLEDVYSGY